MSTSLRFQFHALACLTALAVGPGAHAALFEDDEARRAILDLRQRVERQNEVIQQTQRSLLEQQNQFEAVRAEIARLRGEKEQLSQELRMQQDASKAANLAVQERLRKFEPIQVKADGVEFLAEPAEIKAYDMALAVFRQGDFVNASLFFGDFVRHYPSSGYTASALFWLGNAQYANRDYKESIRNFSALLAKSPDHPRAAETMLSIANCQLELKDLKAARKSLEDVMKIYPQSEAASAARERLAKLK
ncbi:tol-pal system protein YbgF [Limnohabitans sp.]|uniref:tol-pal system protein YbgF n=1 Tax=Limnohabitans sp. TaxID=1907725 RepID=UPI0038B74717